MPRSWSRLHGQRVRSRTSGSDHQRLSAFTDARIRAQRQSHAQAPAGIGIQVVRQQPQRGAAASASADDSTISGPSTRASTRLPCTVSLLTASRQRQRHVARRPATPARAPADAHDARAQCAVSQARDPPCRTSTATAAPHMRWQATPARSTPRSVAASGATAGIQSAMVGADRIDDVLPIRARRSRVAHQPVPQLRIGLIEQRRRSRAVPVRRLSRLGQSSQLPSSASSSRVPRRQRQRRRLSASLAVASLQRTRPKPITPHRIQSTIPPAR